MMLTCLDLLQVRSSKNYDAYLLRLVTSKEVKEPKTLTMLTSSLQVRSSTNKGHLQCLPAAEDQSKGPPKKDHELLRSKHTPLSKYYRTFAALFSLGEIP